MGRTELKLKPLNDTVFVDFLYKEFVNYVNSCKFYAKYGSYWIVDKLQLYIYLFVLERTQVKIRNHTYACKS